MGWQSGKMVKTEIRPGLGQRQILLLRQICCTYKICICPNPGRISIASIRNAHLHPPEHYEVTISAEARGSCAKVTCSVYSVDLGRMNLLEDGEGVLELSRSMAKKLGNIEDGKFKVEIDYEIRRK